jgi:predicted amidohydrolase YtcJ
MNLHFKRMILCLLLISLTSCGGRERVDLLILNASIYTVDSEKPWAEALAILDGTIVAVGTSDALMLDYEGEQLDLQGQMVLPGFHDSHSHLVYGGLELMRCDLTGQSEVESLLQQIRRCDDALAEGDWLIAGGWDLSLFESTNPSKALLDDINPERRMFIRGADGHSAWVSSAALDYAGIAAETPNPKDGVIERDEAAEPRGVLRESAMMLVEKVLPAVTFEDRIEAARISVALAHQMGITSVIDASTSESDGKALDALDADQTLNLRLVLAMSLIAPFFDEAPLSSVVVSDRDRDTNVRRSSAKIFVDGVLEGETAALLSPYIGASHGHGMLITPAESLTEQVVALDAAGVQLMFHAIGDAGVRLALDTLAAARAANGRQDLRHQISHLQLVDPEDHPRFSELDVAANFQSLWAFPDDYIMKINLPVVGLARVQAMYPIGSLQRAGARIVGGSDWPVSSMNPLLAIETAVTRRDPSGLTPDALNEAEAMTLADMIEAYTANGAYLAHREDETGRLMPGYKADLVVLGANLFTLAPSEIGEVPIVMTFFEGKKVYPK